MSPILKVDSPLKEWFAVHLQPHVHSIPVRYDVSLCSPVCLISAGGIVEVLQQSQPSREGGVWVVLRVDQGIWQWTVWGIVVRV
jgi:hypothetical protein